MSEIAQRPSEWPLLFQIACDLIGQVNEKAPIIEFWTLGGGTAMMLHIDHRESHDIDLFLPDPQALPFLNPETNDLSFRIVPDGYETDASRSIKFAFEKIGEIDFIVAGQLTANPTTERDIEGVRTLVETVPEIIAKKLHFRGRTIRPRNIFDIAAAGSLFEEEIVSALSRYTDGVKAALAAMERSNPDFVNRTIADLMIRERFRGLAPSSIEKARALLLKAL